MYAPNFYSTGMSGGYVITLTPDELQKELINKAASDQVKASKPKRDRTKFRPSDVKILEKEFQKNSILRPARRAELAKQLSLKESSLKCWFQNRRKKEKQNGIEKPVRTSVPTSSSSKSIAKYGPTQFCSSTDYSSASNSGSGSSFSFYYPYNPAQLTQFSSCSSNYYAPTLTSNNSQSGYTQFPFCSSTYSPLISPSETISTQFSQCSFANTYPSNIQPILSPIIEPATSQPLPINSTNYSHPLTNTNTVESGCLQFSRDYTFISTESVENPPNTPESVEEQNENSDLYTAIEEYLSALESREVQDTNWREVYNSNNCVEEKGTVLSGSAIKWNSSDYVADAEINNPLDLINMFHPN